jgi:hypothetical protein
MINHGAGYGIEHAVRYGHDRHLKAYVAENQAAHRYISGFGGPRRIMQPKYQHAHQHSLCQYVLNVCLWTTVADSRK